MDQTEITAKNGDTFTVIPLTHARLLAAAKALRRRNIVVSSKEGSLDANLEFQTAVAREVCLSIKSGERVLSGKDVENYLLETPGALDFVMKHAGRLAEEVQKAFEDESGN